MLYAIGDIHGRFDLMAAALNRIVSNEKSGKIVFLGDYVDRGPQSMEVIRTAMHLDTRLNTGDFKNIWDDWELVFLKGNHEAMTWSAYNGLDIRMWLANGGTNTLDSYDAKDIQDLPDHHMTWINNLPLYHIDGCHFFCHAMPHYGKSLEKQSANHLLWERYPREPDGLFLDKYYVVHGHTPIDKPFVGEYRCDLDTGAVFSDGYLTVGLFEPDVLKPINLWRFE